MTLLQVFVKMLVTVTKVRGINIVPSFISDILIRDAGGTNIAVVEVKGQHNVTDEGAAQIRRNIIVHSGSPQVPFFLLLTPSTGFIWSHTGQQNETYSLTRAPDFRFSTEGVLRQYIPGIENMPRIASSDLELVFYQWLTDLTDAVHVGEPEVKDVLSKAGLVQAMQGGSVDLERAY